MALPTLFHRRHVPVRPSDPLYALQDEINQLFGGLWPGADVAPARRAQAFAPHLDVEETEKELLVTAELPGVEEKDFEIELHGDVLTIRGEKREEREDPKRGWYERSYGSFRRDIQLPCEVDPDQVEASHKKGVLTIRLPKPPEARTGSRRIPVSSA